MKFNWGTGIFLVYGLFAVSMVALVVASTKHDPGLVSKNYYDLDLDYQAHYNKKQNAAKLLKQPFASFDAVGGQILVQFQENMAVGKGRAKFYRSVSVKDDFSVELQTGPEGKMIFPAPKVLAPGRWHVEFDWEAEGVPYFSESTFIVAKA